ncbi:hypothetical protein ACN469_43320 [Corallococcus terminator]
MVSSRGGECLSIRETGKVPLYRLYKGAVGDHFDTTSWQERDIAIVTHGYGYEGIACYVFASQAEGTCPLYRLWSGSDHFYTLSWGEAPSALVAHLPAPVAIPSDTYLLTVTAQ